VLGRLTDAEQGIITVLGCRCYIIKFFNTIVVASNVLVMRVALRVSTIFSMMIMS